MGVIADEDLVVAVFRWASEKIRNPVLNLKFFLSEWRTVPGLCNFFLNRETRKETRGLKV